MGTTVHHTTTYNSAANGMAERTYWTLKAAMLTRCTGPDWKAHRFSSPCEQLQKKGSTFRMRNGLRWDYRCSRRMLSIMRWGRRHHRPQPCRPPMFCQEVPSGVQTHKDNHSARIFKTLQTCTCVCKEQCPPTSSHKSVPWPLCRPRVDRQAISFRHEWPHRLGVHWPPEARIPGGRRACPVGNDTFRTRQPPALGYRL